MKKLCASLAQFLKADSGVTAIEYGLIAGVVGVVLVSALTLVEPEMNGNFNSIVTSLDSTKVADDGAWPEETGGKAGDEKSDSTADGGGADDRSGDGGSGKTAGGGDEGQTADQRGERAITSHTGAGGAGGHAGAARTSGRALAVNASGPANADRDSGPEGGGRDADVGSMAADADAGEPGAYGAAAALLPPLDDGAGESWALAPEKMVTGTRQNATATTKDSGVLSDSSNNDLDWVGLLALLLALALMAANSQRAARESERKRQIKEWQEAQTQTDNVVGFHTFKREFRKAA